jgi:hypothetical protein
LTDRCAAGRCLDVPRLAPNRAEAVSVDSPGRENTYDEIVSDCTGSFLNTGGDFPLGVFTRPSWPPWQRSRACVESRGHRASRQRFARDH